MRASIRPIFLPTSVKAETRLRRGCGRFGAVSGEKSDSEPSDPAGPASSTSSTGSRTSEKPSLIRGGIGAVRPDLETPPGPRRLG